jgi:hypothetical protein
VNFFINRFLISLSQNNNSTISAHAVPWTFKCEGDRKINRLRTTNGSHVDRVVQGAPIPPVRDEDDQQRGNEDDTPRAAIVGQIFTSGLRANPHRWAKKRAQSRNPAIEQNGNSAQKRAMVELVMRDSIGRSEKTPGTRSRRPSGRRVADWLNRASCGQNMRHKTVRRCQGVRERANMRDRRRRGIAAAFVQRDCHDFRRASGHVGRPGISPRRPT